MSAGGACTCPFSSTRDTPRDFAESQVCVCVFRAPTVVPDCVFTLVGGGQRRKQRLHVHDEVFMAQGVKTAALTKLDSANTQIKMNK